MILHFVQNNLILNKLSVLFIYFIIFKIYYFFNKIFQFINFPENNILFLAKLQLPLYCHICGYFRMT